MAIMPKLSKCKHCEGSGFYDGIQSAMLECRNCGGTGKVDKPRPTTNVSHPIAPMTAIINPLREGQPDVTADEIAALIHTQRTTAHILRTHIEAGTTPNWHPSWADHMDRVADALSTKDKELEEARAWAAGWQRVAETSCTVLGLGLLDPDKIVEAIRAKFEQAESALSTALGEVQKLREALTGLLTELVGNEYADDIPSVVRARTALREADSE